MAINQAELQDLLTEYRNQNWRGIQTPEWQQKIVAGMVQKEDGEPTVLKRIAQHWHLPSDPLILDIGSGVGNFVVACRERGLRAFGVEPDRIGTGSSLTSLQIAGKRLDTGVFTAAVGEQLPFRDGTFDLVVLDQVIEHVTDQRKVLGEALRVVKPAGVIYVACPNYLCFYEPHYKVWFLPLMPKFLGAWYLRRRGRDPVLLEQLNYTTNWRLRKALRELRVENVIDLNSEDLRIRYRHGDFSGKKGTAIRWLLRNRALSSAVRWAGLQYIRLTESGSEMLLFPGPRT
jgi:SAM-dependent methyltransferase